MELKVKGTNVFIGNGGRAHIETQPWMIFVHGAAMDRTIWALQARYFAHRGWNVVAVDLPGHGRSEGPAFSVISDMAEWLRDVIEALGADKVAVVGHSMGALVAMTLAATKPDKVSKLVLLGVSMPMPVSQTLLDAAEANDAAAFDMITTFGLAPEALIGGNQVPGRFTSTSALRLLETTPPGVLFKDFSACNDFVNGMEVAAKVACPTLLILGEKDRMTPAKAGRSLSETFKDARVEVLPGCGHMMMVEVPDGVVASMKSFF